MRIGNLSGRLTLLTTAGAIDVQAASRGRFDADPQSAFDRWDELSAWVAAGAGDAPPVPFELVNLGAPAPRPRQVFALGMNYRQHAAEAGIEAPEFPVVFTKWSSSFAGPFGEVALAGPTVDWEAELVVVMGRRARAVGLEDAWSHVAGLAVGQDITDRTLQSRGHYPQFSLGKSLPGFSPFGPWIVTPDELENPDDLGIVGMVNGETVQEARTSEMIFSVPAMIVELSRVLTLEPGDVIFTGTPAGVGAARTPPLYLAHGDELTTTIEGIGELRQRFVGQ